MQTNRPRITLLFSTVMIFSACSHLHATEVADSPLSAGVDTQLRAALVNECGVTTIQDEGQNPKKASGLGFFFWEDGRISTKLFGAPTPPSSYTLKGRNMFLEGARRYTPVLRVDEFEGDHFTFFNYATSQTLTCVKQMKKQR